MKQKTIFKEEMRRDLMKVYREVASKGEFRNQQEAFQRVVEHPAPRFYVDAKWAHQRLSPMMRGDRSELEKLPELTRQMYEDLFDVVVKLSQKDFFCGRKLHRIVQFAILEPAPRFYINADTMYKIWKSEVRRMRSKKDDVRCKKEEG